MNQPTEDVVATEPGGDVPLGVDVDLPCHCGYNLRGLDEDGACPECGCEVAIVLDDVEQASLDGRVRRRLGASLLIANHLVWLCMLAGWLVGIRFDFRVILLLFAGAGPRAVTAIEIFKRDTVREFATSIGMLTLLQFLGIWMLTSFRRYEDLEPQRAVGHWLRCTYLVAIAITAALFATNTMTTPGLLVWVNLLEMPVGFLLGAYIAQLGLAERSRLLTIGGRVVSALLSLSSLVLAAGVLWFWSPGARLGHSFIGGMLLSAMGGTLLLALLLRIRFVLGRERIEAAADRS